MPKLNVCSIQVFSTKQEAAMELAAIREDLCDIGWHDVRKREQLLRLVVQRRSKLQHLHRLAQVNTLPFARPLLSQLAVSSGTHLGLPGDRAQGFPNLGNTCYINAVVQCLLHCTPFRHDLERQAAGASFMGDCLRDLWNSYKIIPAKHPNSFFVRHQGTQ